MDPIIPKLLNTGPYVSLSLLKLNNLAADKQVIKYAIDTPVDDILTIHVKAVRPNHGAIKVTATKKTIAT